MVNFFLRISHVVGQAGAALLPAYSTGRTRRAGFPSRMLCYTLTLAGVLSAMEAHVAAAEGSGDYSYDVTGNDVLSVSTPLGDRNNTATGLIKTGSGRLILSGDETYTGKTDFLSGFVTVKGALSGGRMNVGGADAGVYVDIQDGTHVTPQGMLSITPEKSTEGAVTVVGDNTKLELGRNVIAVGDLGTGYLNIQKGGEVSAYGVHIGMTDGNTAVSGAGSSTLYVGAVDRMPGGRLVVGEGGLWVGAHGHATAGVTYGGVLESEGVIHLGLTTGSHGLLKVGESPAAGTGTLIAGDVRGADGTSQPGILGSSHSDSYGMVLYSNGVIKNRPGADLTIQANVNFRDDGRTPGVFDTNGQNTYLTGTLNDYAKLFHTSETGGFTKAGEGTLYLSNHDNGYTGRTLVRQGVLAFTGDGANTGSSITVSNGATLTGDMSASGATGLATVEGGGIVSANGGKAAGVLNIGAPGHEGTALTMGGGTGGSPAILVAGGGTTQAGAPLHVTGQGYERAGGAISTTAHDFTGMYQHLVSGVVHVNGDAVLNNADIAFRTAGGGHPALGDAYQILTATGKITASHDNRLISTGAGSLTDMPFISPYLVFEEHALDIIMQRNGTSFAALGGTRNEETTARGLDRLAASSALSNAVASMTRDQARQALDNLSGELHASIRTALIQDSFYIRNAVLNRLANSDCAFGRNGQSTYDVETGEKNGVKTQDGKEIQPENASSCSTDHVVLWGQAYGGLGHNGGDGNAALMHHNTAGFIMGMDAPIRGSNWRAGGMVSYGHSMFDIGQGRSSSANSNNITVGGYAGTHWGRLHLRLGAAYSWNVINTRRQIAVGSYGGRATSSYLGGTAQGFAELGYRLGDQRSVFEPFMNVAYVNMQSNAYREHGTEAALRSRGVDSGVTFSTFGFRASTRFNIGRMVLMPHFTGAYRHGFGRLGSWQKEAFASGAGGAGGMDIGGVLLSSNAAVIETGLTAKLTNRLDLDLSYVGQYGNQSTESGATGSVRFRF